MSISPAKTYEIREFVLSQKKVTTFIQRRIIILEHKWRLLREIINTQDCYRLIDRVVGNYSVSFNYRLSHTLITTEPDQRFLLKFLKVELTKLPKLLCTCHSSSIPYSHPLTF